MKDDSAPIRTGELIEVFGSKLVAGGDCLARLDGFPLFVGGLYPGDRALVEVTEVRKGFGRGRVERLIVASEWRRAAPCPIADECGGCDWTSLRLDRQLASKREILHDSLLRVGKLRAEDIPPIRLHPSPLNYRLRSRLQVSDSPDPELGFFAARTNRVIPLSPECEVVGPGVLENLQDLRETLATPGTASITTFENGEQFAATVRDSGEPEPEGVAVSFEVRGFEYRLSTDSFFQVNRHLLGTMIDLVRSHAAGVAQKRAALDLYAGVGFFTVALAPLFETVTGVESSPVSFRWGVENTAGFPNTRMVRRDVSKFLSARPRADFVMLDPPRAGLHADASDDLARTGAKSICYLSCDPVTFSRDASRLGRRGWVLRSLDLLDLFPNTHHIETLSSFERER